jgi:large subunit ribosomal protein L15
MDLSNLKPKNTRKARKRVGRGGKRGTYSGKGMKGQKSRAGSGIKPGFRGGDNRIWRIFPKKRGASKKPGGSGNERPHRKHRYFQLRYKKPSVFNLDYFNKFQDNESVTPDILFKKGFIDKVKLGVKILGDGELKKKVNFEGFMYSKTARDKITKAGGTIK